MTELTYIPVNPPAGPVSPEAPASAICPRCKAPVMFHCAEARGGTVLRVGPHVERKRAAWPGYDAWVATLPEAERTAL